MEVCTKDLVPCDKNVTVDIKYPKAPVVYFFFTNDVNTRSFSHNYCRIMPHKLAVIVVFFKIIFIYT